MDNSDNAPEDILAGLFLLMLVFALSLWVSKDAAKNRIPFIEKEYQAYNSTVWFFFCFVISCLGLPFYLFRRFTVLEGRKPAPPAPTVTLEAQLEELLRLKAKGLITEAELQESRHKILGL